VISVKVRKGDSLTCSGRQIITITKSTGGATG